MPTVKNPTESKLAELGVQSAEQIKSLFAQVRSRFDSDVATVRDEGSWKSFRDAWLARKSGVITLITDNWLKPATPELKRAVGASLNELRAHVDVQIEARRVAVESGADATASAKDRI